MKVKLQHVAHARSGDKGDTSNIAMFAFEPEFYPLLKDNADLQYYQVTTADCSVVRMNLKHKPFDDAKVRQAFRLAVDPVKANQITFGQFSTPAEHHHVSPIHPDYAKLPEPVRKLPDPWR